MIITRIVLPAVKRDNRCVLLGMRRQCCGLISGVVDIPFEMSGWSLGGIIVVRVFLKSECVCFAYKFQYCILEEHKISRN